jgi:hypothetical protein
MRGRSDLQKWHRTNKVHECRRPQFFVAEKSPRGIASDKKPDYRFCRWPKSFAACKETADTEKFRKFADAHRKRVYDKMLARVRRRYPNWSPSGMLSGGGWAFGALVNEQTKKYTDGL